MRRRRAASAILVLFLLAPAFALPAAPAPPSTRDLVKALYDGARERRQNVSSRLDSLLGAASKVPAGDPSWPAVTYLAGELLRQRGKSASARAAFGDLASWASAIDPAGPHADGWGGSGLGAVALWRWLESLDHGPAAPDEIGRVLAVAEKLRSRRLYAGMVQSGLLPGLPQVAEAVTHRLAHLAWKAGRQERARALYLDFLAVDSSGRSDAFDRRIEAQLLARRLVTRQRLELLRAERQLDLVKTKVQKDRAALRLERLWRDGQAPPEVRAEAGLEWARYARQQQTPERLAAVLADVIARAGDGPLAARALYRRGLIRGDAGLIADMQELRRRFPASPLADDALFQLATHYFFAPDLDRALPYYEELRRFPGQNDYLDSAYFLPALGLFARHRPADLDAADRLLTDYLARFPNGELRLRCLFWRGRIAERKNELPAARALFEQVAAETPYDSYGLRARLHLEEGVRAARRDLPAPDSRTRAALRQAYRGSRSEGELRERSPYHERLRAAADSGLYAALLTTESASLRVFGRRLDDVPLATLDARRLTPAVALLLALRQDALAARDTAPSADKALRLAGLLGPRLQDWPTSADILEGMPAASPAERLRLLQADPRYLATAYPDPEALPLLHLKPALAAAAWPMRGGGGAKDLSQSLMYALIRQESRFYAGAISPVGALGLLQLTPDTFAAVRQGHGLAGKSGQGSDAAYLLDPERNIAAWAAWRRKALAADDLPDLVLKHNAGAAEIGSWRAFWKAIGALDDLELRVETVRFPETRGFLRNTLRDTAIADAAGFFAARPDR